MKRLSTIMMCLLAMMVASLSAKAQEVTITLWPGWNWISYPKAETQDISTALGDFEPVNGDMLKSQFGNAVYSNGYWRGSVTHFIPGWGYMYYSNRDEMVSFVFASSTPQSQVQVTTSEPLLITAISAMGGGEVTVNDGTYILVKGLCWATHENPTTNDDFYQEAESGVGSFSISMTGLNIATTYYVRAYAVTPNGTVYGDQKSFTTKDGIPEVITDSVTMVFCHEAACVSTIIDNGGLDVIACGVCWSTSPNPTVTDNHTGPTNYVSNSFMCYISGLDESTIYYVRAYASTRQGTGYGEEISFTTQNSSVGLYVDLGLPSGTLWGVCNVGADTPEKYGNYYAWGETQPLSLNNDYIIVHYSQGEYLYYELTKYCNNSNLGYNGFTDNLTILLPEDDAATANLGDDFRMPTKEDWQELYQNTACIWTTQNGVNGMLFTSTNGNTLFLPAGGDWYWDDISWQWYYEPNGISSNGYYWSSSLNTDNPINAWKFDFSTDSYGIGSNFRNHGMPVRPVRCKNSVICVSSNPIEGGSVSGEGTYMDHTTCTLTATAYDGFVFTYWTENGNVVSTDAVYTFVVNGNRTLVANYVNTSSVVHSYVDLGLPSGLLWATCNVGAFYPEGYGDYFAWGETQPKDEYSWSNYQYCNGSYNTLTKYCNDPNYGYNGFTDDLTTLLPEDDAATVNWGPDWRMPTKDEWQELLNNTTHTWTTQNGVNGWLFTAINGNNLFLPASGIRFYDDLFDLSNFGYYWSSLLGNPNAAWGLYYGLEDYFVSNYGPWNEYDGRNCGQSVRAVRTGQNNTPTGAINGKFTINSSGDQVYFSQGNLQYIGSAATPYWKFADNQWDVLGTTTGQNSSSQNVDRDLFGWGTSGWNNGNVYYQPYDTQNNGSSSQGYGYGPTDGTSCTYNLTGTYANADWGVYNPISNGGNQANQWRTLTQPEWAYVFNTRTTSSGIRYAKANVNDVNGVILLPDDWSSETYSLSNTNLYYASFSSNVITVSQWSALEQAGAVFLPAAGAREGTSVNYVGSYGHYWSASDSYSNCAWHVYFHGSNLATDGYRNYRYNGESVRLVAPAEN